MKDALVRSLRCSGPRPDLFEEGPELVTRHAVERLPCAPKCLARVVKCLACAPKYLTCVDFPFCRAIESPIVQRDGFIFL